MPQGRHFMCIDFFNSQLHNNMSKLHFADQKGTSDRSCNLFKTTDQ